MRNLAEAKAANASTKFEYTPVALFVGGTSGIGQATAESFARYTEGNAHIILCGRNEAAAKEIISSFPKHPSSKFEFLPCDVSRLSNVTAACNTLKEHYGVSKLNYLFMSPGFLSMLGFQDNGDGLDKKLVAHFYSRYKFFIELAPQLQAAKDAGEEARVVSVLAAGYGGTIDLDDLGLKKKYTLMRCALASPTYNSLIIEELSKRHPTLSFAHIHPGGVRTNLTRNSWWMSAASFLTIPFTASPSDCAEWMLRPMFDPAMSKGAFHLDTHAEPVPPSRLYMSQEAQTALYDHFIAESSKY